MLGHDRDDDGGKFGALRLVDRGRVGERQLVDIRARIHDEPVVERHRQLALGRGSTRAHDPEFAVRDVPVVIVARLHDLVADPEGPAGARQAGGARRIERRLQVRVETMRSEHAAMHGAQHLNVADRIETEPARDAVADEGHEPSPSPRPEPAASTK